jgi:IclR family acetate operon transcriptional repressor
LATARTLAAHGYLRGIEPGPRYKLGPVLITLGDMTVRQLPLGDMCRPILRELADATGMTTRVALSDHGYPVFIERVDGPGSIRFHTPLGRREPPHATAAGKSILATLLQSEVLAICEETGLPSHTRNTITEPAALLEELNLIRRRGWAIDDEEDVEGVFCIGAAFFDHGNVCVGALSVTGIKVDLSARRAEALGMILRQDADKVSDLLGGPPYSVPPSGAVD